VIGLTKRKWADQCQKRSARVKTNEFKTLEGGKSQMGSNYFAENRTRNGEDNSSKRYAPTKDRQRLAFSGTRGKPSAAQPMSRGSQARGEGKRISILKKNATWGKNEQSGAAGGNSTSCQRRIRGFRCRKGTEQETRDSSSAKKARSGLIE